MNKIKTNFFKFFSLFFIIYSDSILCQDSMFIKLTPGTWHEIPNSRLDMVAPNPLPPGASGFASVMSAWNGAAFDTKRNCLVLAKCGGHGDYAGNEVYTFNMDSLKWFRIWGPTPNNQIPTADVNYDTYDDGNPSSKHTYDGQVYEPNTDVLWVQGGSRWRNGSSTTATWAFSFSDGKWKQLANIPSGQNYYGSFSAYNSVTGKIIFQGASRVYEYDPVADSFVQKGSEPSAGIWSSGSTGVVDLNKNVFLQIGGGVIRQWNLNNWQYSTLSTTGGGIVVNAEAPGIAYAHLLKRVVGWAGGTSVYSLDLDKMTWAQHRPAAENSVAPTNPQGNGTWGRFSYMPAYNAYILVNAVNQNVYMYKLTESGWLVSEPPARPVNIKITN